ncbi:MAG: NAD(P)H-dependent oxidoreductase [Clostridia bacterium]|nr:NAD(P)H-dependent oxidoreductase [Clostridia bacterium]
MVLFINACARPQSRTLALAKKAVRMIGERSETVELYKENIMPLDFAALSKRDNYVQQVDYSDEVFRYAKQFADADEIVIAAPYWDLSFPAVLKCYIEAICVNGLTFRYNDKGMPEGLCKASRLIYITTAGGYIPENNYGYDYIKQLCTDLFGISDTRCIKAEGLDIINADVTEIIKSAEEEIETII